MAALAVHQGALIVGGRFTRAMQPRPQGAVRTGGLASWDGRAWAPVGGAVLEGAVEVLRPPSEPLDHTPRNPASNEPRHPKPLPQALHSSGELLYVGGRFQRLGGRVLSGLVVFNSTDGSWEAVGGGVSGGCVQVSTPINP